MFDQTAFLIISSPAYLCNIDQYYYANSAPGVMGKVFLSIAAFGFLLCRRLFFSRETQTATEGAVIASYVTTERSDIPSL